MGGGGEERRDLWPSTRALCVDKKKKKKRRPPLSPKLLPQNTYALDQRNQGRRQQRTSSIKGMVRSLPLTEGPRKVARPQAGSTSPSLSAFACWGRSLRRVWTSGAGESIERRDDDSARREQVRLASIRTGRHKEKRNLLLSPADPYMTLWPWHCLARTHTPSNFLTVMTLASNVPRFKRHPCVMQRNYPPCISAFASASAKRRPNWH